MLSPDSWRATPPNDYNGPCIALVHGLAAGSHMERHLLKFVREAGYLDATLYSNHLPPAVIAKDLAKAANAGRRIALIGYSQGGSQVVKVANKLNQQNISCDFVVSIAAGGYGRYHPAQWGFNMRVIPNNVKRYLNFYSPIDRLGSDPKAELNIASTTSSSNLVENYCYPESAKVDHLTICRCYPADRVHPMVKTACLDRLLEELAAI